MNATHLFIDISNTWTKHRSGSLRQLGKLQRVPTDQIDRTFFSQLRKKHPNTQLIAGSVVPAKTIILKKIWPAKRLHLVTHQSPIDAKIRYPKPKELGADRLANAAAAVHFYRGPVIVVDFGTAVTFDVISAKGEYLGGSIAPGLNAMTNYLHERAALLPRIQLREPKRAIGRSTIEAMQIGTVTGYRGLIREILAKTCAELGSKHIHIVATGGQAPLLAKKIPEISEVRPMFTLEGLQVIGKNLAVPSAKK